MKLATALAASVAALALVMGCGGDDGKTSPEAERSSQGEDRPTFVAPTSPRSPETVSIAVGGAPGAIVATDEGVWAAVGSRVVRIDVVENRVAASVPIEGSGFEIAAAEGSIWVTGSTPPGASGDLLHRIDPETDRVVATIPLPGQYAGPLAAGDGAVWLALSDREDDSDSLARIDPTTNQIALTVPLELGRGWVDELALADDAVWLLALGARGEEERPGDVIRFDPEGNRVTATIDAEALNLGVGPGGLWISGCVDCAGHRDTFFAQEIDTRANAPAGARVAVKKVGFSPLLVGEDSVWFSGYDGEENTVAFSLDPETHAIEEFLQLGSFLHSDIAFDRERGTIWVASAPSSVVRVQLKPGPA